MEVVACVLLVLAGVHTCTGDDVNLKTPISLAVLGTDLYALGKVFPSPGSWPESKVINYNDQVKFVVKLYPDAAEADTILEVEGECTVAQTSQSGSHEMDIIPGVPTLLFNNGFFYLGDPKSKPVQNPQDYYIVHYQPLEGQTDKEPVIEYMSKDQFERQLMESVRGIAHEITMSGGEEITYYFLMNGRIKIHATYFKETSAVAFKANYFFVHSTSKPNIMEQSVLLDTLTFDLSKKFSPEISSLGTVHGVRVTSAVQDFRSSTIDLSTLTRQLLLKDAQESKPAYRASGSGVFGIIKYGNGRMFKLNYIEVNQRTVLRIAGTFLTQDGDPLCCICVATPEDEPGSGNLVSEKTVLFSCPSENSSQIQILLREDTDFILMKGAYSVVRTYKNPYRIEPYLEYISYGQFLQTMRKVSDGLRIRCENGFHRRSYRLFVNVFLVYDCKTGIAWFDKLDLWLKSDQQESLLRENLSGVSYDSNAERFLLNNGPFTFLRLRQAHAIFPEKIPPEQQYTCPIFQGGIPVAVDLKSVEWDMYKIRENALKNPLPQAFGLVTVENGFLFNAKKSQMIVDGVKNWVVTVKAFFDSCIPNYCVGSYDIIYDGSKTSTGNIVPLLKKEVPVKGNLPKPPKPPLFKDILSSGNQERYLSLSNFRTDMKHLLQALERLCAKLGNQLKHGDKFTVYLFYFKVKDPVIGHYDCMLEYIFFVSDFKAVKHASVQGGSSSYQLGEELTIIPDSEGRSDNETPIDSAESSDDPVENELRKKYSDYVIRDLMYDKKEGVFHSRSMFLGEVFALRLLPGKSIDESIVKRKSIVKPKGPPEGRLKIYVHRFESQEAADQKE